MTAFKDPRWPMQAAISDAPKQWEVVYESRAHGRMARELFASEKAAMEFADATGGRVRKLPIRGGFK